MRSLEKVLQAAQSAASHYFTSENASQSPELWLKASQIAETEAKRELPYEQLVEGQTLLTDTTGETFTALTQVLEQIPRAERTQPHFQAFATALLGLLWHWPTNDSLSAQQPQAAPLFQLLLTGGFQPKQHAAWQGWYVLREYFSTEVQVEALLRELEQVYLWSPPENHFIPTTRQEIREMLDAEPHFPLEESLGENKSGSLLPVFGLLAQKLDLSAWPVEAFERLLSDSLDALPEASVLAIARSPERRAFLEALTRQTHFGELTKAPELLQLLQKATELRPTLLTSFAASPVNADLPKDFAFRMSILENLMNGGSLPPFDVYEFAKTFGGRELNLEQERYDLIPEVGDYLLSIPITPELRAKVTELSLDLGLAGATLPTHVVPEWDGEDELFTVMDVSAEDFEHFPNLERVTETDNLEEDVASALEERGIELS